MIHVITILDIQPYYLIVAFDNGEVRKLDMQPILESQKNYPGVAQLFDTNVFFNAKIGEFGQIYWDNILKMRDLEEKLIPCEYDLSPEFVYENSTPIEIEV
jgi:hypothetical protein